MPLAPTVVQSGGAQDAVAAVSGREVILPSMFLNFWALSESSPPIASEAVPVLTSSTVNWI